MKKFLNHRVLPFVCTLSILVSLLVVPASAASGVGKDTGKDTANRDAWASYITSTDPVFGDLFSKHFNVDVGYRIFFRIIDDVVGRRYGEVDLDELNTICVQLNEAFCNKLISDLYSFVDVTSAIANYTLMTCFRIPNMRFEVVAGGATAGYYRIKDNVSGLYVVNAVGLYPCTPIDGEFTDTDKHNHWVSKDSAEKNLRYSQVMTGADMRQLCTTLQVAGEPAYVGNFGTKYKAIFRDGREVYANPDGYPFVSAADDSEWAVNQTRPDAGVKDENGNDVEELPEENTTGIDLSGMTITLPDGSINFIDKIIYDESTKSYHIDSHDTYNYTVNNYYTWNYYINYTSITYIGQTEEYNKYYEVYYELPDGRDSADLTKEDLEQLNLSVDVIPYGRSADDTSLRSLYHFDGDTKDSSYWNYCTDFTWNKGASLTYMDSGVFEGALYLDETEHDFTIKLPSNIGSSDFTIQFRYYQSATAAPVTDSYLQSGNQIMMKLDGANYRAQTDSILASMPVGSWNEIAIIRSGGRWSWYLNGVCLMTSGYLTNVVLSDTLTFHFGSEQQTFKYIDELRVLNFGIVSAGQNYECTSVPYDTNLTLVLPDSKLPVADEYWSIKNDEQTNILSQYDMDYFAGTSNATNSYFRTASGTLSAKSSSSYYGYSGTYVTGGSGAVDPKFPAFARYNSFSSISFTDEGFRLDSSALPSSLSLDKMVYESAGKSLSILGSGSTTSVVPSTGIFSALNTFNAQGAFSNVLPAGYYTFSLVTSSGNVKSVTFNLPSSQDTQYPLSGSKLGTANTNSKVIASSTVDGYTFGLLKTYASIGGDPLKPFYWLFVRPSSRSAPADSIVYMELVEGKQTALEAEWVESVTLLDKSDLNTPTLAVRTDIDITSYQIGGVRPSIPEKGQVWAMVENDRIVSIQIYNGQAWEGVDGRIWTGQRWIPASSYNIITLQDMYDIVDATPNYEYIYSEAGFWAWWQKSWNAFTEKLFATLGSGVTGSGGATLNPDTAPAVPDDETTGEKGYTIIDLFVVLKDGTWSFITGIVSTAYDGFNGFVESVSSAGSFFEFYDDESEESIFFIPLEEGETIWD